MKKDMEARESQWRAQMEAQKAQLQIEIERMRQTQEQFQAFARVMQNIMPGTSGGSHGPEILPTQMAILMPNIMHKYMNASSNGEENDGRTHNED
ncbi:inactive gamma-glutamyltranspeptidase 4 [Dorcoceras hygrometricum]|uniref:Inactive gamma-glutamyltranspeptidase 4 n=1 Tax=Dorcoceras hygrometricum TaxID=472368 RepID=A0A2Z7AVS5_9LAMI|nr:inactive gamma-glutamyltranspeptidase 4 [Dorcoceras hygrometricum]